MTFSLPAVVLGVVLVAIGLVWIGLLQRRQPIGQKTSLPAVALVPVALVIIGGGVLALQIFSGDPFAVVTRRTVVTSPAVSRPGL